MAVVQKVITRTPATMWVASELPTASRTIPTAIINTVGTRTARISTS